MVYARRAPARPGVDRRAGRRKATSETQEADCTTSPPPGLLSQPGPHRWCPRDRAPRRHTMPIKHFDKENRNAAYIATTATLSGNWA